MGNSGLPMLMRFIIHKICDCLVSRFQRSPEMQGVRNMPAACARRATSVLFTRFICIWINAPFKHGIVSKVPNADQRRAMRSVANVLNKIAHYTKFAPSMAEARMNSLIDNQQPIMTRIYVALRKSDADFLSQIQSYSRVHLLEEDARHMTEENIARLMRGLTSLQHYLYSRVGHEAYWTQTMFPPILSAEREFKGHS